MLARDSAHPELPVDRLRFGPFEIHLETGELSRAGQPIRLAPQPSRVLALLVRRSGQIVTREEIQAEVWSDGTVVEFDQGLNYCIRQIRLVLGEDAKAPQYIETVPKRGYRFVAPVSSAVELDATPAERGRREWWWVIGSAAIALLLAGLWQAARDRPKLPGTPESNRLFLEAEYLVATREPENARKAREGYEEVTRMTPDFAPAWAGLATAELTLGARNQEQLASAEMHAKRAVELDPSSATAHTALGHSYFLQRRWSEAEPELQKALALDENSAGAHHIYGLYLIARCREKEALEHEERAFELAPTVGMISQSLAIVYHHTRNYEKAAAQSKKTLALLKHYRPAYNWLVRPNIMLGRYDAAIAAMEESASWGGRSDWTGWRAYMLARQGRAAEAWEELRKRPDSEPAIGSVAALLALGDREKASASLSPALADSTFVKCAPELEPLRSEQAFRELLKQLGNP